MRLKRSRPEWLNPEARSKPDIPADVTVSQSILPPPAEGNVSLPEPVPYSTMRQRKPVPDKVLVESDSAKLVPKGTDGDSVLVAQYIRHHQIYDTDLALVNTLISSLSRITRRSVEVVGSYADGTVSSRDSRRIVSAVLRMEPSDTLHMILESLRVAGPTHSWTVSPSKSHPDLVFVLPLDKRGLTVHLYTDSVDVFIARTIFAKTYCYLIDSTLAVLTCFLRSKVRPGTSEPILPLELDYFLFTLIWRTMVRARLLPSLVLSETDELAQETLSDIAFWSSPNNPSIFRWRLEGLNARPREPLGRILGRVMQSLDIETIHEYNKCPLDGSAIINDDSMLVMLMRDICDTSSYSA